MHASPLQAYPNPLYTGTCAGVTIKLGPYTGQVFPVAGVQNPCKQA